MRLDFNDTLRVSTHGKRAPTAAAVLHYAVGTKRGDPVDIVEQLNAHGLGYHWLIAGGIVYELAPPDLLVYHASGYNTSHAGIALAYAGPQSKRADGYRQGPGGLWFPPYDPADLACVAELCKRQGITRLDMHYLLNAKKRDPWPLVAGDVLG